MISPECLHRALKELRALVSGERYLVAWFPGNGEFEVVASFGFEVERIHVSEFLSLSILQSVAKKGEARWSDPAVAEDGTLTYQLSGIQSYLCVPVKVEQGVGILYVDHRRAQGLISYTDFANALNLARRLVQPPKEPVAPEAPVREPVAPPVAVAGTRLSTLPATQQVQMFRCLTVLLQAGIPLLSALEALSRQAESARVRDYCEQMQRKLLAGHCLSESIRSLGGCPPWVDRMIYCAERSGQLVSALQSVADYLEVAYARRLKLIQALIYPGAVLVITMLAVVFLPACLLRGTLQACASSGPIPGPTQVLLTFSRLVSHPLAWLLALLLGGVLRALLGRLDWRGGLHRLLLANSLTRRTYQARQEVTLATSLGLQLQAGVPLLEAVRSSLLLCGSPVLTRWLPVCLEQLSQGETLSRVFSQSPVLSQRFCQMLRAGEESGHIDRSLAWVARGAQLDYELAFERASRLLEPLVMLVLGLVVGLVTVATLLPSMQLIDKL